jgi:protein-S-isoprenylcysteine O-methyltransferase Ste14
VDAVPVNRGQGRISPANGNPALTPIFLLGVFLQCHSLGAALLAEAQFAVQLWRMRQEDKVLEAQFPQYASYRARTARLVPGVY